MSEKVYTWNICPNISLLDNRVIAWNEEYIKIDWSQEAVSKKCEQDTYLRLLMDCSRNFTE